MSYSKIWHSRIAQSISTYSIHRRGGRRLSPLIFAIAAIFLVSLYILAWDQHALELLGNNPWSSSSSQDILIGQGGSQIPNKIWQIFLPKHESDQGGLIDPKAITDTASWLALNTDFQYTLVGPNGADEFINHHFAEDQVIIDTYNNLTNVGQKSDFLRYLILYIEGGVYTDTDTIAIRPISTWSPLAIRDQVRLIVGIEFDRRDGGAWADIPHWLQFCQWTIAAAPRHPVFRRMIDHVIDSLREADRKPPTSLEVMTSTGPAAWTDAVFAQLQEYNSSLNETRDLSFMTEPKLYGDILVLSIDGFGMGQPHSHSTNDGSIPKAALMKHMFRGSWRGN